VATKAERARSEMERSGPKRKPRAKKRTPRRLGPHNAAARVAKKAAAQEEDRPETTTPSRVSSRRGANHLKFGSNLKLRQTNRLHSPKAQRPSGT
jgi:hypothetical protein